MVNIRGKVEAMTSSSKALKSLGIVIAAIKFKDTCFLGEKP